MGTEAHQFHFQLSEQRSFSYPDDALLQERRRHCNLDVGVEAAFLIDSFSLLFKDMGMH
jgi:hypothetical protein